MTKKPKKRAIIAVLGKDKIGTVSKISSFMAKNSINIEEISQTIIKDIFTMIMLLDLEKSDLTIAELSKKLSKIGGEIGHEIHVHDEKIIKAMHRI
ncbi:MAG: ACT domain-containing protein [Candidatus Moranbacteria bacterium]|nr:ACT domain-containing protein [Candidatus Moranbacteria bacterium]